MGSRRGPGRSPCLPLRDTLVALGSRRLESGDTVSAANRRLRVSETGLWVSCLPRLENTIIFE